MDFVDRNSSQPAIGLDESNTEEESVAQRIFQTALFVDTYYTPILFLFGTLGNSLSLAVFCMNAKYRSQSASYYLSALAISDTGFLVNLLAVWLENVHGGVITSGVMCPLVMYLGQVTCFMSVYLTVAFSIERFVAVHYPLSRPRICTRSKARKVIAALTGVALLVFSYAWIIAQVIELPLRRDDYDELYEDGGMKGGLNQTHHVEELSPLIVNQRVKRESFRGSSQELLDDYYKHATSSRPYNSVEEVQVCGNGSHTIYNQSFPLQPQNESMNCSRFYSDRAIFRGIDNSFPLSDSVRESSTSAEHMNGMMDVDKDYSEEQLLPGGGGYICSVPEDYYRISEIANYLDSVVTLIIPFFLITFFNVRIAICVWKLKDQRQSIVASTTTDINYHHNHHNSSLRCSTRSSFHHLYKGSSKAKDEQGNKGIRQHLSQPSRQKESSTENGIMKDGNGTHAFKAGSKSHKGTVRFHEDCNKLGEKRGRNGSTSSSGSEENSLADNYKDDDNSNPRKSGCCNHGLTLTARRMISTNDGLSPDKADVFPKPFPSGGVSRGNKWEQEHGSVPQQLPIKAELSFVRERGSNSSSNASEVRVTKTLLLVSTVFVVLNLPAHAIRCALFIQSLRGTSEGNEFLHAAQPWTNILFNTNFAVNFLLYCVSGRNFRKSLKNIILRKFNKNKSSSAWKPVKTCTKSTNQLNLRQLAGGGLKRTSSKTKDQPEVTEVVELEVRGQESICPVSNQTNTPIKENGEAEDVSMTV